MKRYFLTIFGTFLALSLIPTTVFADVNDFYINDYAIDFSLSKNAADRSILTTQERITAIFPETDQNHGIERAIPMRYQDHSTGVKLVSITDEKNQKLPYSTYEENDNLVVRIGNADTYVHGAKTYILTYRQQDVTAYFANSKRDEFYWDTNGTAWQVPINRLAVTLTVDNKISSKLTDNAACYQGLGGENTRCQLERTGNIYSTVATNLSPHQNVTVAIGFSPGTFSAYQPSLWEQIVASWIMLTVITSLVATGLVVWFSVRYYRRQNRVAERTTIVPEYLPPKEISVSAASAIYSGSKAVFTAQLLDFAVRHYIKIYQTADKSWLRPAKYELEIIKNTNDLSTEEQDLLSDIFGATSVGTRLKLESLQNNFKVSMNMQDNASILKKQIREVYMLRAKVPSESKWFYRGGFITLVAAVLTLSPGLLIAALTAFILGAVLAPLTDKGLALYHYLQGLKLYIKVAETERLKMLQSPEGAAKLDVSVDTKDPKQLVKLYERVLPYAILFGEEKEWNKQIGQYYESIKSQPDWYSGNAVFNAAVFSTAMTNFNTAASYTTAGSSGSGGSGGGGSSGGGGGGGGGGGW